MTILIAIGAWTHPFSGDSSPLYLEKPPNPARLSPVNMTVREMVGPYQHHSRLEITLHNLGDRLAVISEARLTIRRVYAIPLCWTQGNLPLSNTYGVLLPIDARPGQQVTVPLHQADNGDEADRFGLMLGAKASTRGELSGTYIFDLDVSLINDGPRSPLSLGRVLVTLPTIPSEGEYYWTNATARGINRTFHPDEGTIKYFEEYAFHCWRKNTALLDRLLSTSAVRSPELDEVANRLSKKPVFSELKAPVS